MHLLPTPATWVQFPRTHEVEQTNSLKLPSSSLQHATSYTQNKIKGFFKVWEERVQLTGYILTSWEARAGTWSEELKQRP